MASDSLTQQEIDQILMGKAAAPSQKEEEEFTLSADEIDALGEIGNICMGASATTLYELLNHRVSITTPRVSICKCADQIGNYKRPYIAVDVSYTEGIYGKNIFLLKREDALLITDILIGGDGSMQSEGLEEMYLSAMSEVMNQMIGASSTSLSNLLHMPINISPPNVKEIVMDEDNLGDVISDTDTYVRICFDMDIEGLLSSEIMQVLPFSFGRLLARDLINKQTGGGGEDEAAQAASTQAAPAQPASAQAAPRPAQPTPAQPTPPRASTVQESPNVEVKPLQYSSFDEDADHGSVSAEADNENLNLLMDVPLNVTVELGKTVKSIQEILEMRLGSIVVLDRLAGEMVDIMVNGKLFARGEVVVIDENYGVRVTEIINKRGNLF